MLKFKYNISAFNTNGIVYDNTPWRPGRDMELDSSVTEEDERRLKNLATRIMSNGVEVLVKDKSADSKQEQVVIHIYISILSSSSLINYIISIEIDSVLQKLLFPQRKLKYMHITTMKPPHHQSSTQSKSLLSSAVATYVNRQQMSAMFPLHQLMQHNYIIKTCMTTYTYLTTVVQNKRSAISTFETIVSVVTTESLTNVFATDLMPDIKPTKVRFY